MDFGTSRSYNQVLAKLLDDRRRSETYYFRIEGKKQQTSDPPHKTLVITANESIWRRSHCNTKPRSKDLLLGLSLYFQARVALSRFSSFFVKILCSCVVPGRGIPCDVLECDALELYIILGPPAGGLFRLSCVPRPISVRRETGKDGKRSLRSVELYELYGKAPNPQQRTWSLSSVLLLGKGLALPSSAFFSSLALDLYLCRLPSALRPILVSEQGAEEVMKYSLRRFASASAENWRLRQ